MEATSTYESPPEEPSVTEQLAAQAAAQSPAELQVVPETRPQVFTGPVDQPSASSRRLGVGELAHGQAEIDAANSEENKAAATAASRTPNLLEGQRVVIAGDHSEAGRMAFVQSITYKDGIQSLLANFGDRGEKRFAEVDQYIVVTRDGRSDTLSLHPDQVKPLEVNEGWGRGQI